MKGEALLAQMTFEEKAALLTGAGSMLTANVARLGIPQRELSDGPHGVRKQGVTDAIHFPSFCCASCTWDEELLKRYGAAIALDCLKNGISMILAPGINIKRSILCGRNFEYLSEDPLVSGKLGAAYICGVQEQGVAVSLKHYAVNSQETDRLEVNAEVDERTLREIYLRGFEIAVKEAQPESVMCAYNKVNAIWCSEHRQLLTEILRDEWGYEGFVVSDWGAVHDVVRSIRAGLDLIMPPKKNVADALREGIQKGEIDMETIDRAALRVLDFILKPRPEKPEDYNRDRQHEIAREIAAAGTVLLKNECDALPLSAAKYNRIAVVGGYAQDPLICGQGAAEVYTDSAYTDRPLDELRRRLPECEIVYWKGFDKLAYSPTMLWPTMRDYRAFIADCDVVVVFMGAMESEDTENFDRVCARMNPNFDLYVNNALKDGKRVIVVLQTGSAMVLPSWHKQVDALVLMGLAGEAAGSAIADVLVGAVNPGGKLTETWPACERRDLTVSGERRILEYGERLAVGYRYYDSHPEEIAYPFGHGLTYTRFEYSEMEAVREGDAFIVTLTVRNTGTQDGSEVVQLYAADPVCTVSKPEKALIAFEKVRMAAGESARVALRVTPRDLAYYNTALHAWVAEAGVYRLMAGASSRDIRCEVQVVLDGAMPYTLSATGETMLG